MSKALVAGGRNELAGVASGIMRYIDKEEAATHNELLVNFYNECNREELEEILLTLQMQHKLNLSDGEYTINRK